MDCPEPIAAEAFGGSTSVLPCNNEETRTITDSVVRPSQPPCSDGSDPAPKSLEPERCATPTDPDPPLHLDRSTLSVADQADENPGGRIRQRGPAPGLASRHVVGRVDDAKPR